MSRTVQPSSGRVLTRMRPSSKRQKAIRYISIPANADGPSCRAMDRMRMNQHQCVLVSGVGGSVDREGRIIREPMAAPPQGVPPEVGTATFTRALA